MARVMLQHVHKIYPGGVTAVHDANLTIEDREFVVLVGPSGCGKSTTLRMIAGLEEISRGTIHIDGRLVNDVPPKDRDIAMVFQNYALYPHMTVRQNMAFGLKLRRYPRRDIDERVSDAARILSIESLLDRKPKALSGGQRQRVAVGRAIVRKPKAFLFDEPLSNLDAKMRVQMRVEINRLHARLAATMIYVTHDQVEAMTMGDRIVVMKDGYIQQVAPPIELYHQPANRFVAGFIGSPAMNFFEGRLEAASDGLWFTAPPFNVRLREEQAARADAWSGKAVTLGVRPEDVLDANQAPAPAPGRAVRARVEVIEPMGAEVYLYLAAGSHGFVARMPPSVHAAVDEERTVLFNMDKAHLFDPATGAALR